MVTHARVTTEYRTTLERAFKAPMLCDITKVHTGLGPMPRVTHCTDEADWGRPGSRKTVFMSKTIAFRGGEASVDEVLERVENSHWKIQVGEFKAPMLGFDRFVGEWRTTELAPGRIAIDYRYALHSKQAWLFPLQWLFTRLFWRRYMRQVLENIRVLAEGDAPFLFP